MLSINNIKKGALLSVGYCCFASCFNQQIAEANNISLLSIDALCESAVHEKTAIDGLIAQIRAGDPTAALREELEERMQRLRDYKALVEQKAEKKLQTLTSAIERGREVPVKVASIIEKLRTILSKHSS
ncbi:MAG: hypothetical protein LBF72_02345 [Holosporales bacterium]|jgi:hypothetical protein|nr:hypothetical protein [Holosporales bacterium]